MSTRDTAPTPTAALPGVMGLTSESTKHDAIYADGWNACLRKAASALLASAQREADLREALTKIAKLNTRREDASVDQATP